MNRKDSFITHRAFCDALAEESARLTSVTSTNLNFKNKEAVINSSQPSLTHGFAGQGFPNVGIAQFDPAGFRPDFSGNIALSSNSLGADHQRPNLSLWLKGNPQINPLDMGHNSGLYVSSSSSGLPEIVQMAQQASAFRSSSLSNFGMPLSNSTNAGLSLSSPRVGNAESQEQQSTPAASPMSATALLQKAAQMGSTKSSNPSIFSGSFGVMSSSSSHTSSLNNVNQNQALIQSMKQPEIFTSTSSSALLGSTDNNFGSSGTTSNSFGQLMMQTKGKQSEQIQLKLRPAGSNSLEHGLTRDFLGVSGGGTGTPFLPQELAKFASMGSPMSLSQFTGNH